MPKYLDAPELSQRLQGDGPVSQALERAAELIGQALEDDGFGMGPWVLPADRPLARCATLRDPAHAQRMTLTLGVTVTSGGSVELSAQVHRAGVPSRDALLASVSLGSTARLPGLHKREAGLERFSQELEYGMQFFELAPELPGGTLQALRPHKRFSDAQAWAPDAAQLIISRLTPR